MGYEMRFFEWMGATIAITGLAMSVQVANAQQCNLNIQTSCVVDTVVISGGGSGGGGGGGTGYPGIGGSGGGGASGQSDTERLQNFVKASMNKFCKKRSESCEAWGARMTTPGGAPVLDSNGLPTGATGAGLCVAAMYSASICAISVEDIALSPQACALIACPFAQ